MSTLSHSDPAPTLEEVWRLFSMHKVKIFAFQANRFISNALQ